MKSSLAMPDTDTDKDGDRAGHLDKWHLEHHVHNPLAVRRRRNEEICSGARQCGERSGLSGECQT